MGGASSSSSPAHLLTRWRQTRLETFAASFDASRYHAQVLFVDDDGARARTCEALLELVAMWADAGWWLYPHAASTSSNVADGQQSPPSLLRTAERLGLCTGRLSARAATLAPSDLLAYDLIVCVDLPVLEQVRTLAQAAPGGGGSEAPLLCLTDFLTSGQGERFGLDGDRMAPLDDELRALLAPHYAKVNGLIELPSAYPSDEAAWEEVLAASAMCCAALTEFLKERFDAYFEDAYKALLRVHFVTAAHAEGVTWAEAEEALRRHQVSGGLTIERRRELFEAHLARLLNV